jgi:hypothetical protein
MSLMSSVTTRSGKPEVSNTPMDTLLSKNHLKYNIPPSLSVSVQRRAISNPAQSQTYNSKGKVNITSNSGDDWVWGRGSYLAFKLVASGDDTKKQFNSARSSAIDIIQTLTLYHSSGIEIERLEDVNLYHRVVDMYKYDSTYRKTELSATTSIDDAGAQVNLPTADSGDKFIIPLSHLSGLFDTDVLLPAYIMSGMRFSIDLSSAATALKSDGDGAATDYTISEVEIVLDSLTLADNVVKELNKKSASSGTELSWVSYENTAKTITTTKLNMSADRAVSRANRAFLVARDLVDVSNADRKKDSLSPNEFKTTQYQWRLGSQFFPNKMLEHKSQMYKTALNCFKDAKQGGQVSFTNFKAAAGDGIMCASLERDDMLDLSGLPVSSSRSLTINADFSAVDAGGVQCNLFMDFVKVAKCFLYDRIQILE